MLKYLASHRITGTLVVETGLRIGAGRETVEIGGIDSPVVRHPHTQHPYIPGSSLKGKLRSLMELLLKVEMESDGGPYGGKNKPARPYPSGHPVLRVFGTLWDDWTEGPSRVIVRDAFLEDSWLRAKLLNGLPLTEEKTEVSIDRIRGKAKDGGLRTVERVPAGARFEVEILFKEYSVNGDGGKTDQECLEWLVTSMKLLEMDALGGSGSRGYGRVRFLGLRHNGAPIQDRFDNPGPFNETAPAIRLFS